MSLDGHFVVFEGQGSRTRNEVMIRNLVTGTTTLVSMAVDGRPAVDGGSTPSVSAHGRFVAFSSRDEALVAGDTNGEEDVFVRDLARRTTVLISRPGAGRQGDGASRYPHISADSSLVTFASYADNLVPRDTNGEQDVFARVLTR